MYIRQTVNLNNIELSYLEWNQGQKPLLLLHGLADHALVWLKLGNFLEKDYHIIAPDLRGHGNSSKPKSGYFFDNYINDLEALLNYLNWQKITVISHSWSAKLACIWATKSPQYFEKLVLVDPFFINSMPSIFRITFPLLYKVLPFLKMLRLFPNYKAAEKEAKKLKQYQGWTEFQEKVFQESIEQNFDGTWQSKFVKQARNEIFIDVMKRAGLTRIINIKTFLIVPKKGLNRTQWQVKPYKKYFYNLKVIEISGNHWAFIVKPDDFNLTVKKLLN